MQTYLLTPPKTSFLTLKTENFHVSLNYEWVSVLGCVNGAITDYKEKTINYTFSAPGEFKITLKIRTPIDEKENETTITIQEEIK